jgi:hypothetical protein
LQHPAYGNWTSPPTSISRREILREADLTCFAMICRASLHAKLHIRNLRPRQLGQRVLRQFTAHGTGADHEGFQLAIS